MPYRWDLPKGKSPNRNQRFPRWTRSRGPRNACWGNYPDAGRGVLTSHCYFSLYQKDLLKWEAWVCGSRGKGRSSLRARGASVVAGVVLAFQPLLHHRVSASEMTIRSAQGPPCVRKLSATWPPKGSCNPPLIQRDPGVERDLRASKSSVGPPARRQIPEEPSKFVAKTQPLSSTAKQKCADSFG